MAVFRVERNRGYTVMSNHHLRNRGLTLKAKGLLSQMLSLPDNWDYTLAGLSHINREKIDAIREAVRELEKAGYIVRSRERDEKGRLRGADYQNKGRFQSHEATAYLLCGGAPCWTAAFLFAQRQHRHKPCGIRDDPRYAALLSVCHVRKARAAP